MAMHPLKPVRLDYQAYAPGKSTKKHACLAGIISGVKAERACSTVKGKDNHWRTQRPNLVMDKRSNETCRLHVDPPTQKRRLKRRPGTFALWSGLTVFITLVSYWPALHGGFVWDDSMIVQNRMITSSDGLYHFWLTTQAPDYYPLTWSLWWIEWRLWGNNAMGYHAANILLQLANALLVWLVLRRMRIPGSWFAAAVFAIHPVNVATVAWISEQKNTLSMLWYLISILLYLRFDEDARWRWYALSLAAFLLALLSKAAVVMLPVVLLGCLWWRRGRIRRNDVVRVVPFFVLALVLGLVTVWFQSHRVLGGHATRTDSPVTRLVVAGWVPWFYLYKDLWPFNLSVIYPKWQINVLHWVSYLPGIAILGSLALFWWKRNSWGRAPLFGIGYFVVTLFPVLGFFDQGFYGVSLVADHWQYFSMVGIIALAIGTATRIYQQWGQIGRYAGLSVGAVVLVVLGTAARTRSGVYADSRTLWQDTLAKNPGAWLAHNNLGYLFAGEGDLVDAAQHYEEALRLHSEYSAAHNNLGTVLVRNGKLSEAIEHLMRAAQIEPDWSATHNNLGIAFLQAGETEKAIEEFQQAIRYAPDYVEAYENLANALVKMGRKREAIEDYKKATVLSPDFAQAHNNLGVLLQADRLSEAMAHYERALEANPDYAEAHFNLGNALVQSGQPESAIRHYHQALRLKPEYLDARYNLGVLLANDGQYDKAIQLLQGGLTEPNSQRFRRAIEEAKQARSTKIGRQVAD